MNHDLVIVAMFADLPTETGNCRYFYLADLLYKQGFTNVELIVSAFSHINKKQRIGYENCNKPYQVTFIEELGYKKNISIKRFYSHYLAAKKLKQYLEERNLPDAILCAIPPLDTGKVVATYCKKNNVKFVLDIQDCWPEAFQMVFHVPIISPLLFYPFKKTAEDIYRKADEIIAVSQTYVQRALRVNKTVKQAHSVFLGTDLPVFDEIIKNKTIKKEEGLFLIAYVGTLGHSYNIKYVIEAVAKLNQKYKDIWFIVMGDGPLMEEFKTTAIKLKAQVTFLGRLEYKKMVENLSICDLAVNPIMPRAAQSIINKVGDYAAAGLPVVSTQECQEYRDLVDQYNIGLNCNNDDVEELETCLLQMYSNQELRETMGNNNRHLAQERFDRSTSYQVIIDMLCTKEK